jgi:hypothetical protein
MQVCARHSNVPAYHRRHREGSLYTVAGQAGKNLGCQLPLVRLFKLYFSRHLQHRRVALADLVLERSISIA